MTTALSPPAPDEWLLFDDAAVELNVSQATLRRYAREGKLLRLYHGKRVYTTRSSIENYRRNEAQKAEARRAALERAAKKQRR